MNATFRNIRFADNALAPADRHDYDLIEALGNHRFPCISVTAVSVASRDRSLGGFDGPFVALLPEPVHSPRRDDVHDRERGDIHLRRRHRRAGLRALPDHRRRTPGSARSRTRAWRSLHGRQLSSSRTARSPTRWRSCWISPKYCRAGPSCNGGCAIWSGTPSSSIRRSRSKNNVARHYDLDGRLYSLFLDADKQYSCAYFETPDATLDDAQLAKKRHLAAKLLIEPGDRVLDIGSGWGGLGLYLAEMTGADVTGVTLSTEQLQVSNARAAEKNLTRSAKFLLRGLSRHSRPVRPHRVGRHVRACRRRFLRDLFQALRRTSHR